MTVTYKTLGASFMNHLTNLRYDGTARMSISKATKKERGDKEMFLLWKEGSLQGGLSEEEKLV